jgi:multidrug resistance efflux pump
MRGKWILFGGSAVLLAAALGALTLLKRSQEPAPVQRPAAEQAPIVAGLEISLSGRVEAQKIVAVPASTDGIIEEFFVEAGEEVYEGQMLARIKNQQHEMAQELAQTELDHAQTKVNNIESAVLTARLEASRTRADASRSKSELDRIERIYQRQEMLNREGATARNVYEKAVTDRADAMSEYETLTARAKNSEDRVASLLKDHEAAKKTLEEKMAAVEDAKTVFSAGVVHAPVDGTIVSRKGTAGEQVTVEMADMFVIATDLSAFQIELEPEPPILPRLQQGQPAIVIIAESANDSIEGKIKEIKDTKVIVEFLSPNPSIKPGLTARVKLKLL